MIKKAIAATFVSAGLLVTVAPGAGAAREVGPAAACHGLEMAHSQVDAHQAHTAIPHCPH